MDNQKQRVYDALNKMNIKYEVVEHEPVHTMEDMDRLEVHPCDNTATVFLSYKCLDKFLWNQDIDVTQIRF